MKGLLLLLIVAIAIGAIIKIAGKKGPSPAGKQAKKYEYRQRQLINKTEWLVYLKLKLRFPGAIVLAQVALGAIIEPIAKRSARGSERWQIAQKYVDFVIYDPSTHKVLMVVEVDGPTHNRARQRKADIVKDDALASAGIQVTRLHADRWQEDALFQPQNPTPPPSVGRIGASGKGTSLAQSSATHLPCPTTDNTG
jgi:hypothetical protein